MTRKELFKAVQELRDKVRFDTRYIGKSFEPEWSALCGKLERFENSLCVTTPGQTIKADTVKLTLLRLQARNLNLYSFKRNPNESWIQKYQLWCDDTLIPLHKQNGERNMAQFGTWMNVEDELPETHEIYEGSALTSGEVLIFNGSYVTSGTYSQTYQQRKYRWKDARDYATKVTHWMPYPPKPERSK